MASQGVVLCENSSHEEVLAWLSGLLSVEQYSQVTDTWAAKREEPDGDVLLSCTETDLQEKLGMNFSAARKVTKRLNEAKAIAASQQLATENIAPVPDKTTPLIEASQPAPEAVELTAGPTVPQKRGRGRPPKNNRQPRLSQRLNAQDLVSEDEEPDQAEEEERELGRNTRQRVTRLAGVKRAEETMHEQDEPIQEADPEAFEPSEDETESEEEEEALPARRRGRPARRQPAARAAPAADAMEEDTQDNRPEEPDDGVHPSNGAIWEDAVRVGLEDILKLMPIAKLAEIVDDQDDWDRNKMVRMKRLNPMTSSYEWKNRTPAFAASKMTKMLLDGQLKPGRHEDGGTTWEGIDEFLDKYVDIAYIKQYLNENLKLRFATPPKISDPKRMLWRLWSRPAPPLGPEIVTLGQVSIPYVTLTGELLYAWKSKVDSTASGGEEAYLSISAVVGALQGPEEDDDNAGPSNPMADNESVMPKVKPEPGTDADIKPRIGPDLVLVPLAGEGSPDWEDLLYQLSNLSGRNGVKMKCTFDLKRRLLLVNVTVDMKKKGEVLINAAFIKRNLGAEGGPELVQVWLDRILQAMDHLKGTTLIEDDLEHLNNLWDDACDQLENNNVALEIAPPAQVDIRTFDKIMAGIEDLDRPLEEGVEEMCLQRLALRLKPYQLRALSFWLREERAPMGTSRHLWLKVPLPGDQPGVECWVSPSLFQMFISKSPIATQQALGTHGGCGWQALEMGMGKTAVAIAGTLFNPPPEGWRAPRPWKPMDPNDYMATVTDNMPRGGTLVVVPTTLVRQWEIEIEKTLDTPEELNVHVWTDNRRIHDCNVLAKFDLVLTTPQMVAKTPTLPSIFWHRIIVDEAQLNAGSMMSRGTLFSTHRWIVTGTPCNASPESLGPSLDFLRLGGYDTAQRQLPPALATVLRAVMLRYTKNGTINGERNLELPPITERLVVCSLNENDAPQERALCRRIYNKEFLSHIRAGLRKGGHSTADADMPGFLSNSYVLRALVANKQINMRKMQSYVSQMRSTVAGGTAQITGDVEYNERKGAYEKVKAFYHSKAEALVADLQRLKAREPSAKVLVFSEYQETLRHVAERLPDIGLQHRSLLGSTTVKKRGEAIEAFMTDPPTRVFLLGAKAGGVGITLTAATHVYIMEPLLNPSLELQAIGRSRRMGQTKPVTVTRMYLKDTIEERVRGLLARRHGVASQSTAMAANAAAAQVDCNVMDLNEILKHNHEEESDDEEESMASA